MTNSAETLIPKPHVSISKTIVDNELDTKTDCEKPETENKALKRFIIFSSVPSYGLLDPQQRLEVDGIWYVLAENGDSAMWSIADRLGDQVSTIVFSPETLEVWRNQLLDAKLSTAHPII